MASVAQRIVTRLALRKLSKAGTAADADNIKTLLRSPLRLDALASALVEEQQSEPAKGPLLDFAQWLIQYVVQNKDDVLALIQAIVSLFNTESADA